MRRSLILLISLTGLHSSHAVCADPILRSGVPAKIGAPPDAQLASPKLAANFRELKDKDGVVGFLLPTDKGVKVELLTKKTWPQFFTPQMNFAAVDQYFANQKRKILFMSVGSYMDRKGDVEGLTFEKGQSVGYPDFFRRHSAAVRLSDGKFNFTYLPGRTPEENDALLAQVKQNKDDMFQQHFAIREGQASETRFDQANFEKTFFYRMRFLTEFKDGTKGIVQLDRDMTWKQAMTFLKSTSVKNAVYLDMGALADGAARGSNGELILTGREKREPIPLKLNTRSSTLYTNLLVFYTD